MAVAAPVVRSAARPGARVRPGLVVALLVLAALVVAVAAPGLVTRVDPLAADPLRALAPPGAGHPLGTDHLGRDVFARVVYGAPHSLGIGALATALAVGAGSLLGLAAGLAARLAGEALARLFDVLSTFPELLLALLVIAITGPGTWNVVAAIGIAQIPTYARVVRAQTFVVRRSGYVEQAVTFGHSRLRVIVRHVLPNVVGPVPVLATIGLGQAVIATSGLSFLGMGPQPPAPEWGTMLAESRDYLRVASWVAFSPGVALTLSVVCLTVAGRHLQRRFEGRTP
jgi:peptide/nickel transport system permease protein